jgi:hypothetical protein
MVHPLPTPSRLSVVMPVFNEPATLARVTGVVLARPEVTELVVVDDAMYCGLQASVSIPPPVGSSLSLEHEDELLIDCGPGYTLHDPRRLWPGPQVAGSDQNKSDMPRALTFTAGGSTLASALSGGESPYPAEADSRLSTKPIERSSWTSPDDAASVRAVRFDDGAPSQR